MPVKLIRKYDLFKRNLEGDKLIITFFSVPWCPRCRQLSPIFRKLSDIYTHADFIKIDSSECPEISEYNEVMGFPTFLFFKGSERVDELIGASTCTLLKKIQILYGNTPLNLDEARRYASKSSMEFDYEPVGPGDEVLGNKVYFLTRMIAKCEIYGFTFKEFEGTSILAKIDKKKDSGTTGLLLLDEGTSQDHFSDQILIESRNQEDTNVAETKVPTIASQNDSEIKSSSSGKKKITPGVNSIQSVLKIKKSGLEKIQSSVGAKSGNNVLQSTISNTKSIQDAKSILEAKSFHEERSKHSLVQLPVIKTVSPICKPKPAPPVKPSKSPPVSKKKPPAPKGKPKKK